MTNTWRHPDVNQETTLLIHDFVQRLHDERRLGQAISMSQQQAMAERDVRWADYSIGSGYAGMAILDAYLDACYPGEGCDLAGYHFLQRATDKLDTIPLDMLSSGLIGGLSGLAFAALLLSHDGTRYEGLLATLDETINIKVHQQVEAMMKQQHGFWSMQFDAITGLAGTGAYLLCRTSDPTCRETLLALGAMLAALGGERDGIPHWYVPHEQIKQAHLQSHYPDGLLDSGLAHGIAGPLATLALMYRLGEHVPDHVTAMKYMADWLLDNRCDDAWGINWGTMYPIRGIGDPVEPARAAWCYGAPGIARALWLAGDALNHDVYKQVALDAMRAVYSKPIPERRISEPNLCHGVAGLLMITLRFWNDTQSPMFAKAAAELLDQLVKRYEPESLLGYRDFQYPHRMDRPDLLSGCMGVALALLAASSDVEPTWDRIFLLA